MRIIIRPTHYGIGKLVDVTTPPTKTHYNPGERFESNGMQLAITDTNELVESVSSILEEDIGDAFTANDTLINLQVYYEHSRVQTDYPIN